MEMASKSEDSEDAKASHLGRERSTDKGSVAPVDRGWDAWKGGIELREVMTDAIARRAPQRDRSRLY